MSEDTIWQGSSSQWKNFRAFALLVLSVPVSVFLHLWLKDKGVGLWIYFLIVIAALWALWKWLELRTTAYHLTSERLLTTSGIFTKVTDTLELYRIRDLKIVQPLLLRMLNLQNLELVTSDATTGTVTVEYIPASLGLAEKVRKCVETCRQRKNVRMMDVVEDTPGDAAPSA